MKLVIDTTEATLTRVDAGATTTLPLYSKQAFEALSLEWVRVGWSLKYYHNFAWFGLPILQLPEDVIRLQEVIYRGATETDHRDRSVSAAVRCCSMRPCSRR